MGTAFGDWAAEQEAAETPGLTELRTRLGEDIKRRLGYASGLREAQPEDLFSDAELLQLRFEMMPLLRFEGWQWPPVPTRDESASAVHKTLFGKEM